MTAPHEQPQSRPDIAADGTWPLPDGEGPCRTWPLEPGCGCLSNTPPGEWNDAQRFAVEMASEMLWRLTAGQYGLCHEVIRPCRARYAYTSFPNMPGVPPFIPDVIGGRWYNIPCSCPDVQSCGCVDAPEIRLPGPVHWNPGSYDLLVWVDGQRLPFNAAEYGSYWLMDSNRLIRTDGQAWPGQQDLTRPITEPGTWGVDYWRGNPVPPGGRRAAAMLACELWKSCVGDSSCRLPQHVQSITREGVQYTMVDTRDYTEGGRTGLPEVDMWLSAVNPRGQRQRSAVWSPDLPSARTDGLRRNGPG